MKLEDRVCSLGLAKKLKELGVRQESMFWWIPRFLFSKIRKVHSYYLSEHQTLLDKTLAYSAFSSSELSEILPWKINYNYVFVGQLMIIKNPSNFTIIYGTMDTTFCKTSANNEVNAKAQMLIYLIENNLVRIEDIND